MPCRGVSLFTLIKTKIKDLICLHEQGGQDLKWINALTKPQTYLIFVLTI